MFPMDRMNEISEHPERFKLIELMPLGGSFPITLNPQVGDEKIILLVDFETTGLDLNDSKIIEIGMVKVSYSPSLNRITEIIDSVSMYEDPGEPIPEIITQITGITDDDVKGQSIDETLVVNWVGESAFLAAHNASFDRGFFDRRFPALENKPWACTIRDIDWRSLGYEGNKLEYLLYKEGYFYQGHRAEVDCLAMAWLLYKAPESMAQLRHNAMRKERVVRAIKSPFDVKDALKSRGYRWNGDQKHWWACVDEADLEDEMMALADLYDIRRMPPDIDETITAMNRYKAD